jgi:hypothetical protein
MVATRLQQSVPLMKIQIKITKALIHKDIEAFLLVSTETLLKHFCGNSYFVDICQVAMRVGNVGVPVDGREIAVTVKLS